MGRLVRYMSISLDGFIAGPGDDKDNPCGTNGHWLHQWLGDGGVRFVTDGIESCAVQAKAAAGDRDVVLHSVYTARECLRARVLDVLEIQLVPVLFGRGRRLFDGLGPGHLELPLVWALELPRALHLRYQVGYA